MKRSKRKSYGARDLAEARAFAKDFCFVDDMNYAHNLDEDKDNIPKIAELIARVRRRAERSVARRIRQELVYNRALAESLGVLTSGAYK